MKQKIQKIIWQEFVTIILALIAFIIFKLSIQSKNIDEIFLKENIFEIFVTIYIPSTVLLIYHLIEMLRPQLYNPLFSIKSKILEKTGCDFSKDSVIKISSTFSTLLENENRNILWELEHIELNGLEQACLNCNFNIREDMQCNTIHTRIRKHRRIRITTIADSLILRNTFFRKNEYFATETRLPSSIIDDDKDYYHNQKTNLQKYKPKKACRLLILNKAKIKLELTNKKEALKDFIDWNNVNYGKDKKLQFKIIVYNDKLEDVFSSFTLDSYYDFVISKKGKQITVFAQNENNVLTSFDSSYENNKQKAETFYNAFQNLFNHGTSTNGIAYSKVITTIGEAETFINSLT